MANKSTDIPKKKSAAELLREKKIQALREKISQDEEMATLLTGEQSALFHDNLVGVPVTHKQFGDGNIEAQQGQIVTARFASGSKRFCIPRAFLDNFLSTSDDATHRLLDRYRELDAQLLGLKKSVRDAGRAIALLKK